MEGVYIREAYGENNSIYDGFIVYHNADGYHCKAFVACTLEYIKGMSEGLGHDSPFFYKTTEATNEINS